MIDLMDNVPEKTIKCLDKGFVTLVDVMPRLVPEGQTADSAIVQAARVSYGAGTKKLNEDRGLIRYLMRHSHTTPTEMCLSGSTLIPTMPGKHATRKVSSIKRIAEAFAGVKPEGWAKQLKIRSVNQDGTIVASHVKYAKKTGKKPIYRLTTTEPLSRTIVATGNHLFLTPDKGYVPLSDLLAGNQVLLNGKIVATQHDLPEMWSNNWPMKDITDCLGVSSSTIYRRLQKIGMKTSRRLGFFRKPDQELKYPRARSRKHLKKDCEICGYPAKDVHHLDNDESNNKLDNLLSVCKICHKAFHNDPFQLRIYPGTIASIEYIGIDDVYDLEVESENHNFVADGFVVHNCEFKFHVKMPIFCARQVARHRTFSANEISGRFSILPDEFYFPEVIHEQSKANKQGGDQEIDDEGFVEQLKRISDDAYSIYQKYLDAGLSREQARMILPLNLYTEFYWKNDLHNLLHFLALRCDPHAQWETRCFAEAILKLITPIVPITIEAWQDYHDHRDAIKLTRLEIDAIRHSFEGMKVKILDSDNKREQAEWHDKAAMLGLAI
jgi:flavin-dependent thymidylate synthase